MALLSDLQVTLPLQPPSIQEDHRQSSSGEHFSPVSPVTGNGGHVSPALQDVQLLATDHSELSSGDKHFDNADSQPRHESHASTSSPRNEESTSRARSNSEPPKNTPAEKNRYMIRLPSWSGSVIASASRSPSIRMNTETCSKSPTSHNNTTRTMGSPSNQMSRPVSSSGFVIKIPPPRKQLSVPEAPAITSAPATPPPSVVPTNNAEQDHTSASFEGLKKDSSIQNIARSDDSGPTLQNLPITVPNKLSVAPVADKKAIASTSLVDALGHAFTKNALGTQSSSVNHSGWRRPITFISPVLTKTTSDSSSMQMRQRNRDPELYTQRSRLPQENGEKGKGRILDEDEWEDLLSANVVKVVFDTEAKIQVSDHVRKSNLRHLLRGAAVPDAVRPSPAENFDKDGTEAGPMHLPPRFAKFAPSGGDMFLEMLENTFGPDAPWGEGPKPKMAASDGDDSQAQSSVEQDGYGSDGETTDVQVYGLGVRKRRALGDIPRNNPKRARVDAGLSREQATPKVDREQADSWAGSLQGLVKGKMKISREQMASLSEVLKKVDQKKAQVRFEVAVDSRLWQTVTQLSQLETEDIPFGDEHGLLEQARRVASFWRLKWASEMQLE